ncbi:hypothetical protein HPB47_012384 [Ixodes persulcatus]|uniref:Uncharacterized protein n=1 Tax=Ixodes persulcatus TaxID=34615 RepID=A0AC60NTQ5_IXOPE|nr:hypothetical protein HPB47_012384 [Ixodes persulcatus]
MRATAAGNAGRAKAPAIEIGGPALPGAPAPRRLMVVFGDRQPVAAAPTLICHGAQKQGSSPRGRCLRTRPSSVSVDASGPGFNGKQLISEARHWRDNAHLKFRESVFRMSAARRAPRSRRYSGASQAGVRESAGDLPPCSGGGQGRQSGGRAGSGQRRPCSEMISPAVSWKGCRGLLNIKT